MVVCICNNINEYELKEVIETYKVVSMSELQRLGVADSCTKCFHDACDILKDCVDERFKDEEWYISPKENCHWSFE